MSKQFILAYCVENSNIAKEIEQNLGQSDYVFEHVSCSNGGTALGDVLSTKSEKIILLISDNFLRSAACMKDGLSWFQNLSTANRILPVVVDGRKQENGAWKPVPTKIGKVSNVIKYMNFWQEQYLELRKSKRNDTSEELSQKEHLNDVRNISSEVGEFLRHVRSSQHFSYDDFRRNNYEELFHWNGDMSSHKKLAEAPQNESFVEQTVDSDTEEPVIPVAEDLIATPEMSSTVQELNPVELAKPEPIEIPSVIPPIAATAAAAAAVPVFDNKVADVEELKEVEKESNEDSFESLINEVVAEEEEKQAVEGVSLEDFDKEMFGDDAVEIANETVSVDAIATENIFAVEDDNDEESTKIITDAEKHKVIEEILTSSREALANDNVPSALNILKGGTEQYPDEVNLRYYYAYVLANSADNQKTAKVELNRVLKQTPQHADANYLAGEIAELDGNYIAAKSHYSRVISVDEKYPNAHYRLASILAKRFRGKEDLAVNYFKIAAKQDKTNVDALFQTANLYERKLKKYDKAKKYYQKVLKYDAENADVYLGLARTARAQDKADVALEFYKKAVEIDSNLATHLNQRLFAPSLVIQKAKPIPVSNNSNTAEATPTAKDLRLKELEADIERLQAKLSEMEQEIDKQSNDQQKISTSIHKISGNGNGNGNGTHAVILGTDTEVLSVVDKEPGKVVFITGATSGIGKATSEVFARNGYRVILTGRRWERLEELKSKYIADYQADVKILSYDVRNPVSVKEAIQSLEDDWRNVDILINNAGLAKGFSPIQEGDMRHWEQMIDTNIKGLLYMTRAVAPHMVERRGGHIINVCSTAGHEVYPNGNVYCATKHAVDALTKSMRIDLHKHNVRVSQVSPGHVEETEFALVRFDGDVKRAKIYDDFRPLTSRDVAETIYFMASRPAHVNIQDILLMGTQQASSNHVDRSGR